MRPHSAQRGYTMRQAGGKVGVDAPKRGTVDWMEGASGERKSVGGIKTWHIRSIWRTANTLRDPQNETTSRENIIGLETLKPISEEN